MPEPQPVHYSYNKPQQSRVEVDNTGHQQHMVGATSMFGMAYDFAKTNHQNMINARRYREQVADNRANAAVAYKRQLALQKEAERYNSVQNKVSMLREAGLNPALAYGDLGSSAVSAGSADQAASGTPFAAEAPSSDAIAAIPQNLSVAEDIRQKQITNKYLDAKSTQEIFKMITETNKILADTSLSEEQRNNLVVFRDQQLELLKTQAAAQTAAARHSISQADYLDGAATDLAAANAASASASAELSREKAKTEPSVRAKNRSETELNEAKKVTEEDYNRAEILSRTDLNKSAKTLNNEEIEKLDRDNSLSRRQKRMIDEWCAEHGYDDGVSKMIYQALDQAAKSGVESLSTWLDAGNWLPFVSNMVRNFTWRNVMKSDDIPPSQPSQSVTPSPSSGFGAAVKPNPSVSNFEKHVDKIVSSSNSEQKVLINYFMQKDYPRLSEIDQYNFRKEFYDCEDASDCIKIIKKYKNIYDRKD